MNVLSFDTERRSAGFKRFCRVLNDAPFDARVQLNCRCCGALAWFPTSWYHDLQRSWGHRFRTLGVLGHAFSAHRPAKMQYGAVHIDLPT